MHRFAVKTHETFVDEVYELVGEEYEVMDKYHRSSEKLKMFHKNCGKTFKIRPSSFLRGQRCSNCATNKRITKEEAADIVKEFTKGKFEIHGDFESTNKKVKMRHTKCGRLTEYRLHTIKNYDVSCRHCDSEEKKKLFSSEEVIKKINEAHPGEYIFLGEIEGWYEKVLTKMKCGHSYERQPYNLFKGKVSCDICAKEKSWIDQNEFEKHFSQISNNAFEMLQKPKRSKDEIKIRHKKCKNIFYSNPNIIRSYGLECIVCRPVKGTKGEVRIAESLIGFFQRFVFQKKEKINNAAHRFDFYLPDYNAYIEFDGEQHYKPVEFMGGKEQFDERQLRDKEKDEYCKSIDARLLRIPYWDYENINELIYEFIKTLENSNSQADIFYYLEKERN